MLKFDVPLDLRDKPLTSEIHKSPIITLLVSQLGQVFAGGKQCDRVWFGRRRATGGCERKTRKKAVLF
jgi:hypothetical protein